MSLFDGELAGVHDPTGRFDAGRLGRALPGVAVVESGGFCLAARGAGRVGQVHAALAGRIRDPDALRQALGADAALGQLLAIGYERWGSALVERLRGPFALVAWDADRGRGLLAQDPLGGRSLFTFRDAARLFFATEVALLLALLDHRPGLDELALAHHLVDHSVPDGRMLYEGVRRLGGGRQLELSEAGQVERMHWSPRYEQPLQAPRAALADRLRQRVVAAVADAVPTDQRTAILLSGGLDSSVVAGAAATRAPGVRALAATFPAEPDLDERAWAQRVAKHLDLPLTEVPIDRREPLRAAEAYLSAWQLPLPVPGLIVEEPLIAAARDLGVDVVLDGQGGDELFGAAHFFAADMLRHLRPRAAWRLARRHAWLGEDPPLRHLWQVFRSVGLRGALPPGLHEAVRRRRGAKRYAPAWLRPRLMRAYHEHEDPWRWKRLDGPRWWAWLADALTRGREAADIADYVRRRGRMGGVDGRSPLLDLDLVEFALRLPPATNFDPVTSRPLVREALRGTLPPDVLARRDKRDFAGMYHRALQAPGNLSSIRALLDERSAAVREYVDLRQIHRDYLQRPPRVGDAGWRAWSVAVWNVVTAEQWLRNWQR